MLLSGHMHGMCALGVPNNVAACKCVDVLCHTNGHDSASVPQVLTMVKIGMSITTVCCFA
jgi:hypothetical protein